jgi:hypothetical protein
MPVVAESLKVAYASRRHINSDSKASAVLLDSGAGGGTVMSEKSSKLRLAEPHLRPWVGFHVWIRGFPFRCRALTERSTRATGTHSSSFLASMSET